MSWGVNLVIGKMNDNAGEIGSGTCTSQKSEKREKLMRKIPRVEEMFLQLVIN